MVSQAGSRGKPLCVEGQITARLALGPEATETPASLWKGNGEGSLSLLWGSLLP